MTESKYKHKNINNLINNHKREISIIKLNSKPLLYKVTKRYPIEGIQDTKFFDSLKKAEKQFKNWKENK